MIVFDLICSNEHPFEGWFASTDEFSRQQDVGMLVCPVCRDKAIAKRPSAVHINRRTGSPADKNEPETARVSATAHFSSKDLQEVLDFLLKNSEDVGSRFPAEARQIHLGESPKRAIRGQASRDELDALSDEGIEVLALPIPSKGEWH